MRILHVVTLVSPTGAFGGPLRVALNQAAELGRRGHDVLLVAGWDGEGDPPTEVEGVPARLFRARQVVPGMGFSGLLAPGLVRFLRREAGAYDVVHVHAGRDLISQSALAAIRRAKTPYVTQTHGMVTPDSRPQAKVLDALFVRRQLEGAATHMVLTGREEGELQQVLRRSNVERVLNGVPLPELPTASDPREVLYCARMHPRKRPEVFVAAAAALRDKHPDVRFAMVGPDEGSLPAVLAQIERLGLSDAVSYEGSLPYGEVLGRVGRAGIYVLPSVDEPFPMSLLEAMSLGVASICTDTCGIADVLAETAGAVVTDASTEQLVAALDQLLLDEDVRSRQGARGRAVIAERFAISAVVEGLELVYAQAHA